MVGLCTASNDIMSELDRLRAKLNTKHGQLRDAEAELAVLRKKAAESISAVEAQEREVKTIRTAMSRIEDEIIRLS